MVCVSLPHPLAQSCQVRVRRVGRFISPKVRPGYGVRYFKQFDLQRRGRMTAAHCVDITVPCPILMSKMVFLDGASGEFIGL